MTPSLNLKKLIFFGGFGFLPLWASITFVYVGSIQPNVSPDYWAAAPWLFLASMPLCGLTLGMVGITLVVYKRTTGTASRQFKYSALTFLSLCLAVAATATLLWAQHKSHARDQMQEKLMAMAFVKSNRTIAEEVGENAKVSMISTSMSKGMPTQYEISASGKKQTYAIVKVTRSLGRAEFSLSCITPLDSGHRNPFKHPCQ